MHRRISGRRVFSISAIVGDFHSESPLFRCLDGVGSWTPLHGSRARHRLTELAGRCQNRMVDLEEVCSHHDAERIAKGRRKTQSCAPQSGQLALLGQGSDTKACLHGPSQSRRSSFTGTSKPQRRKR